MRLTRHGMQPDNCATYVLTELLTCLVAMGLGKQGRRDIASGPDLWIILDARTHFGGPGAGSAKGNGKYPSSASMTLMRSTGEFTLNGI
jgi:hypothetical protein